MNKTAIKNFAIWARNKLIADITYKAGLLGISEKEIKSPLPQSTQDVQFFDIGTKEPYSISGIEIKQRGKLATAIDKKAQQSDYQTAYKMVIEEVAYTWFNRLIAVRFMEVNDYLPSRIRALSSESTGKNEPDLVTNPSDTDLDFTPYEKDRIVQMKNDNQLDELFRMLFIKQCNALNAILPNLFEKTCDYTELLLNVAFTDQDGVVYHLVHDIPEDDYNVSKEGQVEIIGWLYQYYNTEPKDETFALLKKNVKITKERIPAATQLFTPDWIVRYMVENSLGRLWLEGHPNDSLQSEWKYYLDEAEQEVDVQKQLDAIREEYKTIKPEDIKVIDPCMGSGHILVYAFDVLMQIYESYGYSQRDAAKSIVENNIYGLDIDNRAYQLAYFAVMMKARQYNRRILNGEADCHVYVIQESNDINCDQLRYFGAGMDEMERNTAMLQMQALLDTFTDAKEYGSILNVENYNWKLLYQFVDNIEISEQMTFDTIGIEDTKNQLRLLVEFGAVMVQKYDVVVTNPPYMVLSNGDGKLNDYVKKNYPDSKVDLFSVFMKRCLSMGKNNRYVALMTSYTWMFLSSYKNLREDLLINQTIVSLVQPEYHAFFEEAYVPICTFVIRNCSMNYKGEYIRLQDFYGANFQPIKFLEAVYNRDCGYRYSTNQGIFSKISGMPIAYWACEGIIRAFKTGETLGTLAMPKQGISTTDNNKFVRFWSEVLFNQIGFHHTSQTAKESHLKWFPLNKGGEYRRWYGNRNYLVNYQDDGMEIKNNVLRKYPYLKTPDFVVKNSQYYFEPCISWSKVTSNCTAFRYFEPGFIFSDAGMAIVSRDSVNLDFIFGFLNSKVCLKILEILSPTLNYEAGHIDKLPILMDKLNSEKIEYIVQQNVFISKVDWDSFEGSWDFKMHPLIEYRAVDKVHSTKISNCFEIWEQHTLKQFDRLKRNEEKLNRIFIEIYGLQDELNAEVEDKDITIRKADLGRDIRSFVSYAVGCMFGRYSLGVDGLVYAGGGWNDSKYSTFIPDKDNILPITDEEYFEDDIVGLFVAFVKKVYGAETLEQNLDFIAKALGNRGNTSREIIRNYFVKDFFKDHCKIYQKRPIYWLFDSGKVDGFKALIYMHRYDENTIGNLRIDYLHQMQRVYDREIARMQETINNSTNAREVAAAEKRKEKLTKQLKETKDYDEKIAHLALARIVIDLDDGVKVNYEKVQTGTDGKKLEVLARI